VIREADNGIKGLIEKKEAMKRKFGIKEAEDLEK